LIQFDPTLNLGTLIQLAATIILLFYIGRWVGRMEVRQSALEDTVQREMTMVRKEIELGDKAIGALVEVAVKGKT